MKTGITRIFIAIAAILSLGGCSAFTLNTPYGNAASDGKTTMISTQYGGGSFTAPAKK